MKWENILFSRNIKTTDECAFIISLLCNMLLGNRFQESVCVPLIRIYLYVEATLDPHFRTLRIHFGATYPALPPDFLVYFYFFSLL